MHLWLEQVKVDVEENSQQQDGWRETEESEKERKTWKNVKEAFCKKKRYANQYLSTV